MVLRISAPHLRVLGQSRGALASDQLWRSHVDQRAATWVGPIRIVHAVPTHIGAQSFAGDGAVCGALDAGAAVGGNGAAIEPVPNLLLASGDAPGKCALPPGVFDGLFEHD